MLSALVLVGLGCVGLWMLQAALPQTQPSGEEVYQDFRQGRLPLPPLVLLGVDADTRIKAEDGGLRIAVTAKDSPQSARLGVAWPKANLAGDFEITATYELLSSNRRLRATWGSTSASPPLKPRASPR